MKNNYLDIKSARKTSNMLLDFDSDEFRNLFYDSIISKATHSHSFNSYKDNLYFEIILAYFDTVISLEFTEVESIISESTLGYFPEIRSIKISNTKNKNVKNCEFIPMWSEKVIKFDFNDLIMKKHVIKKVETNQKTLGSI